ncbi:MAG: FAD:protein FMN transferase [Candidatus Omnitrophota bacterium]
MMKRKLLVLLIIIIIGISFWRTQSIFGPRLEKQCRMLMDTYVTVYAYGKKPAVTEAIDQAYQRMKEVSEKFNAHDLKSPIYAFNHSGVPIRDEEILELVRIALEISQRTEGAYDITVFPLVKLWGFYGQNPELLPAPDKINQALSSVGYKHLRLTERELTKDQKNIFIDLASLAKGYVVGQGIEALRESGVSSAIIQAGGDIYALGDNKGKPWGIGLRDPRKEGLLGYVQITDQAVMGSGNYERFFIKEGKRYNHIIDPQTGYPAEQASGVTVIYADPVLADAWATALSVTGPAGLKIIETIPGMEAVMVTGSDKILYTAGLKRLLKATSGKKRDLIVARVL